MTIHVAYLLNSFLLSVLSVLMLTKIADPIGLVDLPVGRKRHEGSVPVVGGLAMFFAFLISALVADNSLRAPWEFIAALAGLVLLGTVDDLFDLPARVKLAGQSLAVMLMIVPGWHVVQDFGWTGADLRLFAFPFTFFFVLGVINAFNMLDGLDGLAAGVAAAALFWLAMVSVSAGRSEYSALLLLLASVLGFLVFNAPHPWRRKASVFMGDAGSLMLGAVVAFFVTVLAAGADRAAPMPALIYVCAIPAIDTVSLVVRRLAASRSPMAADRSHLHHLFLDAGVSPALTSAIIVSLTFALGGIGFAAARFGASEALLVLGLVAVGAVHTWFVLQRPWTSRDALRGNPAAMPVLNSQGKTGN